MKDKQKPIFTLFDNGVMRPAPIAQLTAGVMSGVMLYTHAHTPGDHPSPPWPPDTHVELEVSSTAVFAIAPVYWKR